MMNRTARTQVLIAIITVVALICITICQTSCDSKPTSPRLEVAFERIALSTAQIFYEKDQIEAPTVEALANHWEHLEWDDDDIDFLYRKFGEFLKLAQKKNTPDKD